MNIKQFTRRLIMPTAAIMICIGLAAVQRSFPGYLPENETFSLFLTAAIYLSTAWVASRVLAVILDQAGAKRPFPRLLKDLISAALFIVAFASIAALYMGQGAIGALAGSGIMLALIGFAIRNVVADTLSGLALAIEGPFRIGDWIDIDTLAQGKVVEIGWRTTRIQTPDVTYLILPNSQISRQRITNYSAPKREFRATGAPLSTAADLAKKGLRGAELDAAIKEATSRQIRVSSLVEQSPEAENRVTLDPDKRDANGMPLPRIHYDYSDYTRAGLDAAERAHDEVFAALGATNVNHSPDIQGAGHIIGTVRMGKDAKTAVVDSDLRSFDHRNLFLLGSGTFPTSATANPSLTIAALSLRAVEAIAASVAS